MKWEGSGDNTTIVLLLQFKAFLLSLEMFSEVDMLYCDHSSCASSHPPHHWCRGWMHSIEKMLVT